jgi:hypothetical protein
LKKYRTKFDWDVLEIDQNVADKLMLVEMRKVLDDIEKKLLVKWNNPLGSMCLLKLSS